MSLILIRFSNNKPINSTKRHSKIKSFPKNRSFKTTSITLLSPTNAIVPKKANPIKKFFNKKSISWDKSKMNSLKNWNIMGLSSVQIHWTQTKNTLSAFESKWQLKLRILKCSKSSVNLALTAKGTPFIISSQRVLGAHNIFWVWALLGKSIQPLMTASSLPSNVLNSISMIQHFFETVFRSSSLQICYQRLRSGQNCSEPKVLTSYCLKTVWNSKWRSVNQSESKL